MSDITVESTTQKIVVNPATSSISVVTAGPMGPAGPTGASGSSDASAALTINGQLLTRAAGVLAAITRDVLATDPAFSSRYISPSILSANGQLLTRSGGVPAPISRASLAADSAFSSLYAPIGAYTAYTPVMSGTGWAVGNGTITGEYYKNGKEVTVTGKFTAGSTSTFGAAQLNISLPPGLPTPVGASRRFGEVLVVAGNVYRGVCWVIASATTIQFFTQTSATGQVGSLVQNSPATLANGHTIEWELVYKTA